jgi:calcium-dependent protein kinase
VEDRRTHQQYAMKCIPKVLTDTSISEKKREDHADAVRREVDVMKRMRGVLNVASLEAVYEDDDSVYIVMEYCTGGELVHVIGDVHYTEQTVASFMRATLRTLAQCHANGILHRDIKPGNFLLASDKEDAPLKAIDFGLAAFVEGDGPATDLGLEGTPWYMAPETLSNEVYKASDIWAAGVMAYQLLTGKLPFNDKRNPYEPVLSQVWKSILMDPLNMSGGRWENISSEAKDFVAMLLDKVCFWNVRLKFDLLLRRTRL